MYCVCVAEAQVKDVGTRDLQLAGLARPSTMHLRTRDVVQFGSLATRAAFARLFCRSNKYSVTASRSVYRDSSHMAGKAIVVT